MKFFKAQFAYDSVYYDTRTRLESVARDLNDKYWGNIYPNIYISITKITLEEMFFACALKDIFLKEDVLEDKILSMLQELMTEGRVNFSKEELKSLKITEVSLSIFDILIEDNGLAKLFHDKHLLLEKIGFDPDKKCFREILLDTKYWKRQPDHLHTEYLMEDERKRLKYGRKRNEATIQPVHYIIFENDKEVLKGMIQELLFYLCPKNRICNRRVVAVTDNDIPGLMLNDSIQNLSNLDGGTVIAYVNGQCNETTVLRLVSAIYSVTHNYSDKYTAIIILPDSKRSLYPLIKHACSQWAFVEINNKKLLRKPAEAYFKKLMKKDGIEPKDDLWKECLNAVDEYTVHEVTAIYKNWLRNVFNISKFYPQYQSYISDFFKQDVQTGSAKEALNDLIGLENVKKLVSQILDFFKLQALRKSVNPDVSAPTMHMIFYGNPGTAKTTVARLLGKILKEEKILEKGEMFEVGRQDLVGKYVGWTAKNVSEYFEKAKGSVLFIDEAYSLADEQRSFGDEAINTLVQEMENHRNDTVVIMAGYKTDMQRLLAKNQGLQSRISFFVEFPDYSKEELFEILEKMVREENMLLDENIYPIFSQQLDYYNTSSGNGRLVRNIFNMAKIRQAGRVLTMSKEKQEQEMFMLKKEDFEIK